MTPDVAILIACHDRQAKTLACLASVFAQAVHATLHVVLFDDGSTDGTVAAVRQQFPDVEILAGQGDAFWAGGMRSAFDHALRRDHDFYLWLNDDVVLVPGALGSLLGTAEALRVAGHPMCLLGGAVADPTTGEAAYGGINRRSRWMPLRFERCRPHATEPRRCDTLNGNVVLVPRTTAQALGSIGAVYRHTLGDLDYGLRATARGAWVGLVPGCVGVCAPNTRVGRWFNPELRLAARWHLLRAPLGFPLRPWLHFARQHGGPFWFLLAALPFWRLAVPPLLLRGVRNLRAVRPQLRSDTRAV